MRVYMISGVCAAMAGLIIASELTSAAPQAGTTYELNAIAAVVIGGASLAGGRGTVRGALVGAFVIGFLSDGLVMVGRLHLLADGDQGRRHRPRRDARPGPAAAQGTRAAAAAATSVREHGPDGPHGPDTRRAAVGARM